MEGELQYFLVLVNGRKISILPHNDYSSGSNSNDNGDDHHHYDRVDFNADPSNKVGIMTCVSVSNCSDNSVMIATGHERGHIIVWHNIAQFYVNTLNSYNNASSSSSSASSSVPVPAAAISVPMASGSLAGQTNKKGKKRKISMLSTVDRSSSYMYGLPICTILHWHAHAVNALSLTMDGNTLYSGGEEGVLVVWHNTLSSASLGASKSFFPRLGAPISFINNSSHLLNAELSCGIYVSVTTTDNCIHVIDTSSMKEVWELHTLCIAVDGRNVAADRRYDDSMKYQGRDSMQFYLGTNSSIHASYSYSNSSIHSSYHQSDDQWRCFLVYEPRTKSIVCNGYPGQLQAYDYTSMKRSSLHSYAVSDYTRVSKKERDSIMFVPSVSHVQFVTHSLGYFLATVEVRQGNERLD
jgi:hypothetical protein